MSDGLRSIALVKESTGCVKSFLPSGRNVTESLILAQNERWRHGLGMQVEREAPACWSGKWRKGE